MDTDNNCAVGINEKVAGIELLDQLRRLEISAAAGHATHRRTALTREIIAIIDSKSLNAAANVTICGWLAPLQQQEQLQWAEEQLECLLYWLKGMLQRADDDTTIVAAYACIDALVKTHPQQAAEYWPLFDPQRTQLLWRLRERAAKGNVGDDLVLASVQCLDTLTSCIGSSPTNEDDAHVTVATAVGECVLDLYYGTPPAFRECAAPISCQQFLLCTLPLLAKISALCLTFAHVHVGELLGVAKALLAYGLDAPTGIDARWPTPQRVHPAQQTLHSEQTGQDDDHDDVALLLSGPKRTEARKVSRTRRPRAARCHVDVTASNVVLPLPLDLQPSDSDASEPDSGGGVANKRAKLESQRCARVRLLAINLLGVSANALERRALYANWHALFSGGDVDHRNPPPPLLHAALRDPAVRCRSAALQVAGQLFYAARAFLRQAEGQSPTTNATFLTFAQNLALMVAAMHHTFAAILAAESSLPVLMQALKCLAMLVQATPYQRLPAGSVDAIAPHLRRFAFHPDPHVQVVALTVLELLIAPPRCTPEIAAAVGLCAHGMRAAGNQTHVVANEGALVVAPEDEEYCESDEEAASATLTPPASPAAPYSAGLTMSWLLRQVLDNLACSDHDVGVAPHFCAAVNPAVRVGSLQVLATMAGAHFDALVGHLASLACGLHASLLDASADVRLYGARCLDSCAYAIGRELVGVDGERPSAHVMAPCEQFWRTLLPFVLAYVSDAILTVWPTTVAIKITLCDALANMGMCVYERLPHAMQLQLISLLGAVSAGADLCEADDDAMVRAAALRAMAVYVLFPSLRDDLVFVENAAEAILRMLDDRNLLVRVKATWALGNVSEALNGGTERISDELLHRLIVAATQACHDRDNNIRSNAVRTLGNLLRLLSDIRDERRRALFGRALAKLCDCARASSAGSAKVKWNACYAIGVALRNEALYETGVTDWQADVCTAMCHAVVHHGNFKVRIGAVAAIRQIERRARYGVHYEAYWAALLAAIEQSVRLEHFSEYNHRDQLQEQLCLTIGHLVACAQPDDLVVLKRHLAERLELVRSTWLRAANRLVPERAAPLLACAVLLHERYKRPADGSAGGALSVEQRNAVAFIVRAFECA